MTVAARGIPHNHTTYVEGCFRCALSRDEMVSTGHYSLDMLNEAYRENTRRDIEWLASRLHAKHCRQCDIVRSLIAALEGAESLGCCSLCGGECWGTHGGNSQESRAD